MITRRGLLKGLAVAPLAIRAGFVLAAKPEVPAAESVAEVGAEELPPGWRKIETAEEMDCEIYEMMNGGAVSVARSAIHEGHLRDILFHYGKQWI